MIEQTLSGETMPEKPSIAVDLDSTLAETLDVATDLLGVDYEYSEFSSWDEPIEKFGPTAFLNAVWHAWTIRPDEIEPTEPNVDATMLALSERASRLDVVTAHPQRDILGLDSSKRQWLDDQGITYNAYRSVHGDKHSLGYDIYVDNNPNLVEEAHEAGVDADVYLYAQPHNTPDQVDAPDEAYTRVESLREVLREVQR